MTIRLGLRTAVRRSLLIVSAIFVVVVALCRSALFEMGNTRVIAAVYGPREVIPLILFVYLGVHV